MIYPFEGEVIVMWIQLTFKMSEIGYGCWNMINIMRGFGWYAVTGILIPPVLWTLINKVRGKENSWV